MRCVDLQLPSSRLVGLREDSKMTSRDMAAADPAGLRSQVTCLLSRIETRVRKC